MLRRLVPEANILVVQRSLDHRLSPAEHYALVSELKALRKRGMLIVGSGKMVHNLRRVVSAYLPREELGYDWSLEFDAQLSRCTTAGDHAELINDPQLGDRVVQQPPVSLIQTRCWWVLSTLARWR